jgi:hypothetical protein
LLVRLHVLYMNRCCSNILSGSDAAGHPVRLGGTAMRVRHVAIRRGSCIEGWECPATAESILGTGTGTLRGLGRMCRRSDRLSSNPTFDRQRICRLPMWADLY